MILNRVLSIRFLVGIHSNVAEGAFLASSVNGSSHRSSDVEIRNALGLPMATSSATELFQSYHAAAGKTAEDQTHDVAVLNMEDKRRMDDFKSLFRNREVKNLLHNSQYIEENRGEKIKPLFRYYTQSIVEGVTHKRNTLAEIEKDFDDHIRDISKSLANDQTEDSDSEKNATEIPLKDACAVLSSLPLNFNEAVDFFLGEDRMYLWISFNQLGELFRKMVKILFAVGSGTLNENNGGAALIFAAREGYTEIVKLLLDRGANVNVENNNGFTPLSYAANNGYTEIVKLLLDRNAKVHIRNKWGLTALSYATNAGYTEIVHLLLDCDPYVDIQYDRDLWFSAAREGYTEIVKRQLNSGVNDVDNEDGETALVDIRNEDGNTALLIAAERGHTTIVELLIEHGAKVNIKNESGYSALLVAAERGYTKIVKLLRDHHADDNVRNCYDYTALFYAASKGYTDIVELLLDRGAKIDFKDIHGNTALSGALCHGRADIVKLLIDHGAQFDILNDNGPWPC